jgi:NAD(P)-dependent dehydrogenase (short-subunit alcohol dehydrogenase family)
MSKTAEQEQKVAVVTGSSSGIGFETSIALAKGGFYTYATMRKLEEEKYKPLTDAAKSENLQSQVIELNVNNDKSVTNAIDTIVDQRKRIDVLVNNADYALGGALEETSMNEVKAQFETNFFGAVRIAGGNTCYEKTKNWQSSSSSSKHNVYGRKNIYSS